MDYNNNGDKVRPTGKEFGKRPRITRKSTADCCPSYEGNRYLEDAINTSSKK